jgi:hypothetical protein
MLARRSPVVPVVLAVAVAVACSSDSGGPAGASAMVVISGGGQSGHVNAALPLPLVVRLTGSGGNPFSGATVSWSVTSGIATVAPASSTSDADGRTQTVVTLGGTPGAVVVTASTSGPSPVTFALTAVGPASLAVVSGSGQTGPVGGAMAESLRVALTGTDGLPYAGGTVAWAITAGAATASPALSLTNASGETATLITPAAAGALTVTASSGTATPATFTGTAVPPCDYLRPYALGQTVNGTLTTLDCAVNLGSIFYYDFYQLDLAAQQSLSVHMSSSFDTWIDMFDIGGSGIGVNDDSLGLVTNSYVEGIFAPGSYVIGASSFSPNVTGAYTVRSGVRPATIAGCRVIFGTRPITVTETINTTDCGDTTGGGGSTFYSDRLVLGLDAGATLQVRMTSGAVDPSLYLFDFTAGAIVASNDDSAAGVPTAYLTYSVTQSGFYFVDIGTGVPGQTGAYTITVGGTGAAVGVAPAGAAAARLPAVLLRGAAGKAPIPIRIPLRHRLQAGEGAASP